MNGLVYHIVSGHSFFSGATLVVIAVLASTRQESAVRRISAPAFSIGVIAIALSSTAIPYWCYAVAAIVTFGWCVSRQNLRPKAACLTAAAWLFAAGMELPFHITSSLEPTAARSLAVVGDSVTAGVGGDETSETWPSILARGADV